MEIIDQPLPLEEDERGKMRECITVVLEICITVVLEIGITCSLESPKNQMEVREAANELCLIKNLFLRETGRGEGTMGMGLCQWGNQLEATTFVSFSHPFCSFS